MQPRFGSIDSQTLFKINSVKFKMKNTDIILLVNDLMIYKMKSKPGSL